MIASRLPSISAFALSAAASLGVALGQSPADDSMQIHRDIEYARPDGTPVLLDLYEPKDPSATLPVVIWIHGGGWMVGNKDSPMLLPMVRQGFAVVSIDYRLSQQAVFPAQIFDCKAAVRWVRANAATYHLNPDKIGVAGASAGGHLAALLGTTEDNPQLEGNEGSVGVSSRVQAVVDYFGPTDFITIVQTVSPEQNVDPRNPLVALLGGPVAQKMDLARLASPVYQVSAKACPFFIVHGDSDTTVSPSQSVELNDALKKAGVSSQLTVVKGGGHGFNDPPSFLAAIQFLKQQLQ